AATVERLLGHYRELLKNAVAEPDSPIGRMQLLTPTERERVLGRFNATHAEPPTGACIHHLVEAQAARTPDAMAVSGEDRQLTYAELDQLTNRLARHLQSLGVGPETLVGVCLDRTTATLVGVLGILKAGGAHVP